MIFYEHTRRTRFTDIYSSAPVDLLTKTTLYLRFLQPPARLTHTILGTPSVCAFPIFCKSGRVGIAHQTSRSRCLFFGGRCPPYSIWQGTPCRYNFIRYTQLCRSFIFFTKNWEYTPLLRRGHRGGQLVTANRLGIVSLKRF